MTGAWKKAANEMIPVFKPSLGEEEIEALRKIFKTGWIGLGPKTSEFEAMFAEYIGVKHAVALNSGTAALHLAVKGLGISEGEILVPAITFVSTAFAADYNNCKPVFVDVEEDTLCISIEDLEQKITPKTKAIIPVHYGGHACKMDELLEIAEKHNLPIIEDCAHSCGGSYKGKKTGSLGDAGCFSFHAVKNLATGDGGMLTTNNDKLAEEACLQRWVGINKNTFERSGKGYSWYYDIECVGYKCHMNDITAVIGIEQLKKLDSANKRRREIFTMYNKAFSETGWIECPVEKDYAESAFHNYVIKVKEDRNKLIQHLKEKEIDAGVHYMPLHHHPVYKHLREETKVPVAEKIWESLVTLPLYPAMSNEEVQFVIDRVKSFA